MYCFASSCPLSFAHAVAPSSSPPNPPPCFPKLQLWVERSQLDTMRTVCYQPGPIVKADVSGYESIIGDGSAGHEVVAAA